MEWDKIVLEEDLKKCVKKEIWTQTSWMRSDPYKDTGRECQEESNQQA